MAEKSEGYSVIDIARLSGVSRSTVSRVLNGQANVKESTRQRVLETVRQYNFTPNPVARALVNQRTRILGVVIPYAVSDLFSDSFFPQLLQSITIAANSRDHAVTLWLTSSEENIHQFYQRIFSYPLMDGIVIAAATVDYPLLERLQYSERPHMIIGRPHQGAAVTNFVDVDGELGAYQMTQHLIERGRRRIGFVPGLFHNMASHDRLGGYGRALTEAGLPVLPELISEPGDFKERVAYQHVKPLLERGVDAIFAASDTMALGVMRAVQEAGLRIPDDIALGGFDDMPFAAHTTPPLTTVYQPIGDLGRRAVIGLIDLLEGQLSAPYQDILPVELRIRSST